MHLYFFHLIKLRKLFISLQEFGSKTLFICSAKDCHKFLVL